MDGMEKLLLLGGLGLAAYWLTNKATAAVATAHPSTLPANESVVVFNNELSPEQGSAILRGSFVNGLGAYAGSDTRIGAPMLRMPQRVISSSNPAMPVTMLHNAPVNDRWSESREANMRPYIKPLDVNAKAENPLDRWFGNTPTTGNWQAKEEAYLRANPNSTGPWIHNADGTVQRGFPQPGAASRGLAPISPLETAGANPNAPVYYNGVYQGTAAQVADSQAALARTPGEVAQVRAMAANPRPTSGMLTTFGNQGSSFTQTSGGLYR